MMFFGWIAAACFSISAALGVPLLITYAQTGLVPRVPTAVLATGLVVVALLMATAGLVLDSIAKGRIEAKRSAYLQSSPSID